MKEPLKEYKGKITLSGKTYDCKVVDGIRYIDGVTADRFVETHPELVPLLALKGNEILTGNKNLRS